MSDVDSTIVRIGYQLMSHNGDEQTAIHSDIGLTHLNVLFTRYDNVAVQR
ncbi:hypothetical protein [Secundilactobacillus muriivasis]